MLASVFILFEIPGLLSSIHAVLQPRTSQGAIAWIVCLIALPVVAVPAYWIFGRSRFNGYVTVWLDASLNIDDDYSRVGTVNFDNRSFRLNFEVTAAVADRQFATEIESMLQDDF